MRRRWCLSLVQASNTKTSLRSWTTSTLIKRCATTLPGESMRRRSSSAGRYCLFWSLQCPHRKREMAEFGHSANSTIRCKFPCVVPYPKHEAISESQRGALFRMVCGRAVDAIELEKAEWYMQRSTPSNESEQVTRLRREAYEIGQNAG